MVGKLAGHGFYAGKRELYWRGVCGLWRQALRAGHPGWIE
jgi:hypothetical protein